MINDSLITPISETTHPETIQNREIIESCFVSPVVSAGNRIVRNIGLCDSAFSLDGGEHCVCNESFGRQHCSLTSSPRMDGSTSSKTHDSNGSQFGRLHLAKMR